MGGWVVQLREFMTVTVSCNVDARETVTVYYSVDASVTDCDEPGSSLSPHQITAATAQ